MASESAKALRNSTQHLVGVNAFLHTYQRTPDNPGVLWPLQLLGEINVFLIYVISQIYVTYSILQIYVISPIHATNLISHNGPA